LIFDSRFQIARNRTLLKHTNPGSHGDARDPIELDGRMRCFGLLLVTVVACGAQDPRPATVEVISLEILAPSCGAPQCHSTSTNQSGYAFDTLAAAKAALRQLVHTGTTGGHGNRDLMGVINDKKMPPDAPLDPEDVALIQTWITNGAPGL